LNVLFIGDVFGALGRNAVRTVLPTLKVEYEVDFCLANCENASPSGMGISGKYAAELLACGVDLITLGNHCWKNRDAFELLKENTRVIRPINYPHGSPGAGSAIVETEYGDVGVVCALGRIFMDNVDCPFRAVDSELERLRKLTNFIIVDMHGEATSEKYALAYHVDGIASFVAGTHTHVQTADERVLPKGTGYITDIGMTGPDDGVIGVDKDLIIKKLTSLLPVKFEPASGFARFCAVLARIDETTGMALDITRISRRLAV